MAARGIKRASDKVRPVIEACACTVCTVTSQPSQPFQLVACLHGNGARCRTPQSYLHPSHAYPASQMSLPASVGALLMDQDASRNGALLFELTTPGGSRTHAGVLEFNGPEGVVAVPRKVAQCLWGPGAQVAGPVTVTYKRLEKGTFVR